MSALPTSCSMPAAGAGAHHPRARGTAGGTWQRGDRGTSAGRGPVSTFAFHLSTRLPFGSSLPSPLFAPASRSLRDWNPSKPPGQAAAIGRRDVCSAWTSEDQMPSAAGHGHSSLAKHPCADAFLHCPPSFSLRSLSPSTEDRTSPGRELNNLSPANNKHSGP